MMSNEDRPFQAEQVYEQIELLSSAEPRQAPQSSDARLISNLRQVYAEDRKIVEHVWESLNARAHANRQQGADQATLKKPEMLKESQPMKNISHAKRPKNISNRLLELSAALLVVGALVVGMLVLLQRAHQQPGLAGAPTVSPHSTTAPVVVTQTPAATQTQLGCSVSHPATMTPLSGPTDPAVFYLTGGGGYQAVPSATSLIRYDLVTGKTTTLVQPSSDSVIVDATLSPDKQWLLLRVATQNPQKIEFQVIRTDGSMLQTVYESCSSGASFGGLDAWSPNGREIAFPDPAAGLIDPAVSLSVLDLTSGKLQRFFLPGTDSTRYQPAFWADNQHLLVKRSDGPNPSRVAIDLLDISKGVNQRASSLAQITSLPMFCGNIAPGGNGSQLFSSSCTAFNGNCQGQQVQGPSSVSMLPALGGATRTIYSSQSRAVTAIAAASSSSLLIYIENTTGDRSQDGLWKINTDGSGLTRLTTTNALACQYNRYVYPLTQISSNGARYALLYMDGGEQKLIVGSLAGGSPTTIIAHQLASSNVLVLAGVGVS